MEPRAASLAIISSYPPPYGGVGIHTQRLAALLDQRRLDYVVYNATSDVGDGKRIKTVFRRRKKWLLAYLFTAREPVIYFMSDRLAAWVVAALLATWRGKRVLLRLRNAWVPDWIKHSPWRRVLAGWVLRRMDAVVCVSAVLREAAASLGVPASRLHLSPGFLPPRVDDEERKQVAPEVWRFMEGHQPIISANGKIAWYKGEDLYGLDQIVELAARLKNDYPNVGIVFCFADFSEADRDYLNKLLDAADRQGVRSNILLHTQSGVFAPVLAASTVFVRPSNTDGDAISVREALYLGVPTVASDAVIRPAGAVLFRTRDMGEFEARVRDVLKNPRAPSSPRLDAEDEQRINRYLDLLESSVQESTPMNSSPSAA